MSDTSFQSNRILFLGTNGTGKTSLTRRFVDVQQRTLVCTAHDGEWTDLVDTELKTPQDFRFHGIRRHIYNPKHTLHALQYFRNGLLLFDDCRMFLKASTAEEIRQLLIGSRQRKLHLIFSGHGFSEVPPVFFTFASDLFLFKTRDNINKRKDCINRFEDLKEISQRVNHRADDLEHSWMPSGNIEDNIHYFEYVKM